MKAKLKKINVAGTWTVTVTIDAHAEGIADISSYLIEVTDGIETLARHEGNKEKHKVNVKKVATRVNSGI